MSRWAVQDPKLASALSRRFTVNAVPPASKTASPISEIISSGHGILLLASASNGNTLIAHLRVTANANARENYVPSGFLGLSDELELHEESKPPNLWKKLWE